MQNKQELIADMEVSAALSVEDERRIAEIEQSIQIEDANAVIHYGASTQTAISEFSDKMLKEVRVKDAGEEGKILSELMERIKDVDVESLSSGGGFFSRLPLIGGMMDRAKRFMARYESLSDQIERLVEKLHSTRTTLVRDIEMFEQLYDRNLDYYRELNLHIIAGDRKLKQLMEVELPARKQAAEASTDPIEAQKYRDFESSVNRFEKKLHDLKLSQMVSLQSGPQIRLIQNTNQLLVEKIQSSILNTIPLWKNQITIAVGLMRQRQALELQKEVSNTTNQILERNAEMLKTGTLETARESERGIVELDTLQKVHTSLIETIEESLKIQQEGRQKRVEAERELIRLEAELKQKLTS